MKNYLHILPFALAVLGCFCLSSAVGQTYASAATPVFAQNKFLQSDQRVGKQSVRSVLLSLEESYHVSFNYDDSILQDMFLDNFSWNDKEQIEEVLKRLTEKVQLKFEKVDKSNYLIFSKKRKEKNRLSQPDFNASLPTQEIQNPVALAEEKTETAQTPMNSPVDIQVSGVISDEKGLPLPGANVVIKGTTIGTTADGDGKYVIEVPNEESVLIFSFIGYISEEVVVGTQTSISINLTTDLVSLGEVVVVGYGEKKRSEIIGSVATISPEELKDLPVPNMAAAMRGQIAGVSVSQVSGRPGAPVTLNIRNASISGTAGVGDTTEPLYIIDGITVGKTEFDNLDMSMVESVSFLKDASAAIYGASGAKGVVLVKTKRGKAGKTSITYNGYMGQTDAARRPDNMLSAYEHAALWNENKLIGNTSGATAGELFSQHDLDTIKTLKNKSWFDEIWKPSLTQRHNIGISGGTEKVTFFAGGSYQNENANYSGMKFDKYSFRTGITVDIAKGVKADVAFNVDNTYRDSHSIVTDNDATFIQSIITTPQWVPISIDGKYVYTNSSNKNALAYLNSGYHDERRTKGYRINANLSYQPEAVKGLTARLQVSQTGGSSRSRTYTPPFGAYNFGRFGQNSQLYLETPHPTLAFFQDIVSVSQSTLSNTLGESNSYQAFLTLQYSKTLGRHSFTILGGAQQERGYNETSGVRWNNQLIPGGQDYWAFDSNTIVFTSGPGSITESTKRSSFGRFDYEFDSKYLLEAVVRRDASSNFALGNRWGLSPSIGAGWVISRENFFADNVRFINFLKFKYNYGITGDDRVTARLWQERATIDVSNGYLYGTTNNNSLNPSLIPNPDITWEKKRTSNFGVEMSLFANKLDLTVEFFQNKVYDGFDRGSNDITPLYAGITPPVINYREAYNWGQEFTIGYKTRVRQVKVNVGMNFAYGNSIVTKTLYAPGALLQTNIEDGLAGKFGTNPKTYTGSNYGLIYTGKFRTQQEVDAFLEENPNYRTYGAIPQQGWMRYEDINKDGVIDDMDLVPMYKNPNSFFSPGINIGITYKSLSLRASINAQFGGKTSYDSRARTAPTKEVNVLNIWRDRWTVDNPDGWMPRFDDPTLTRNSTFWMVDATMIRVNNMTLSYQVPPTLVQRLGLQDVRLLVTGNNLWTLVNPLKYKDPYTSSAYDYPTLRTISLGLNVKL